MTKPKQLLPIDLPMACWLIDPAIAYKYDGNITDANIDYDKIEWRTDRPPTPEQLSQAWAQYQGSEADKQLKEAEEKAKVDRVKDAKPGDIEKMSITQLAKQVAEMQEVLKIIIAKLSDNTS